MSKPNLRKKMKNSYLLGVFLAFFGGILWGISGVCGEYLFTHKGVSASWLVPNRLFFSGVIMLTFYAFRLKGEIFAPLKNAKDLTQIVIFALFGLMAVQFAYFHSIELSNAAVATVIQYTAPIFILAYVCYRQKRLATRRELLALVLATSGVFLLATHAEFDALYISPLALFWCFVSAVCVIFYNLAALSQRQKFGVGVVLAWGLLIAGVVLGAVFEVWNLPAVSDFEGLLATAAVVFLGTIFAFGLYLKGVELIGAEKASFIAAIEPVSAAVFGVVWLKSSFGVYDFVGFLLIMSCVVVLSRR